MMDRIANLIRFARVRLADDSGVVQHLQVDEGQVGPTGERRIIDKVKMIGLFGFWSVPPIDSEVLLASAAADRSRTFAVGSNHQASRPKNGQPGDAGIYDVRGRRLTFSDDGAELDAAGGPVTIRNATIVTVIASDKILLDAPVVATTHDLQVGGNLTVAGTAEAQGDITGGADVFAKGGAIELSSLHDVYHSHTHGGVKAGTDHSAGPDQGD